MKIIQRIKPLAVVSVMVVTPSFVTGGAPAADVDPLTLLKKMTEPISSQSSISALIDTDIEVVTPELQKCVQAHDTYGRVYTRCY